MKHYIITLLFCFIVTAALAQQRIPDLSLPPDESLKQPNISNQNPLQPVNPNPPNAAYIPIDPNAPPPAQPGAHFIDGYCDPNFRPLIANTPGLAGMQECLEAEKRQSCDAFRTLPADAKGAVSQAIDCRYQASNGEVNGEMQNADGCSASDTARLQLLKKYWSDSITAQALVFLPDDVLGLSGHCMGKNR